MEGTEYQFTMGLGETITCDDCNSYAENWFTGDSRAICEDCYETQAKEGNK